nr:NADH dehydrogenase subunit 3 [Haliotis virginea]UVI60470.1 NADH dehydrogenase subunit 3 [Haliotis virginea]UVI60626.1 NADH dehydrogenase subunit 3 [Haliotis virginea]UVI60639.1 NADH dehydrogenase subunit 3 [Haliotis virginea]UVI60652.1 NADH dehydrogenase subunit 3 [Haliotis virginea]
MMAILTLSSLALAISSILMVVAWILAKRSHMDREKSSPFECGFDPMSSARLPFSLRFFLLAVIFLIFDVEIVLLFPAITKMMTATNFISSIGVLSFLLILILGLFHEWNEGSLNWME